MDFQFAPDRHAMSDTARPDRTGSAQSADVVSGGLAFDRRIRRDDDLVDRLRVENLLEEIESEFCRPDAVQRGEVPRQDEVAAAEARRVLDRDHIRRRLDNAEQRRVAGRRLADRAEPRLRQHATALAVTDCIDGGSRRLSKEPTPVPIALQQVERHPLRGLRTDTRQASERLDETRDERRVIHLFSPAASSPAAD